MPAERATESRHMTSRDQSECINLCSGAPWNISLVVERIGTDLLCRIHGGVEHVGAVAVGHWDGSQAHVEMLAVGRHKEGALVATAAHKLSRASKTTVVCVAGIHYDEIEKNQIDEILGEVDTLTADAVRELS